VSLFHTHKGRTHVDNNNPFHCIYNISLNKFLFYFYFIYNARSKINITLRFSPQLTVICLKRKKKSSDDSIYGGIELGYNRAFKKIFLVAFFSTSCLCILDSAAYSRTTSQWIVCSESGEATLIFIMTVDMIGAIISKLENQP